MGRGTPATGAPKGIASAHRNPSPIALDSIAALMLNKCMNEMRAKHSLARVVAVALSILIGYAVAVVASFAAAIVGLGRPNEDLTLEKLGLYGLALISTIAPVLIWRWLFPAVLTRKRAVILVVCVFLLSSWVSGFFSEVNSLLLGAR